MASKHKNGILRQLSFQTDGAMTKKWAHGM